MNFSLPPLIDTAFTNDSFTSKFWPVYSEPGSAFTANMEAGLAVKGATFDYNLLAGLRIKSNIDIGKGNSRKRKEKAITIYFNITIRMYMVILQPP